MTHATVPVDAAGEEPPPPGIADIPPAMRGPIERYCYAVHELAERLAELGLDGREVEARLAQLRAALKEGLHVSLDEWEDEGR